MYLTQISFQTVYCHQNEDNIIIREGWKLKRKLLDSKFFITSVTLHGAGFVVLSRHGILHKTSASVKIRQISFHKSSMIFDIFRITNYA